MRWLNPMAASLRISLYLTMLSPSRDSGTTSSSLRESMRLRHRYCTAISWNGVPPKRGIMYGHACSTQLVSINYADMVDVSHDTSCSFIVNSIYLIRSCVNINLRSVVVNSVSLFNDLCDLPTNARKRDSALLFACSVIISIVTMYALGGTPDMKISEVVVAWMGSLRRYIQATDGTRRVI